MVNLNMSYDHLVKLLIIGDSGAGKTSLLLRFSDEKFENNLISTIGIDFKIKTVVIDGLRIKVQIWDTAGQERFHTLTRAYYRGAHGILLVYDVTNRKTFEHVGTWLSYIIKYSDKNPALTLVGNKCDLSHKRQVSSLEGELRAEKSGCKFFETSAKNDVNVTKAFFQLVKHSYKNGESDVKIINTMIVPLSDMQGKHSSDIYQQTATVPNSGTKCCQ